MSNNLNESYESLKKAYEKLKEFIETDNGTEKDRGAIINAFQYTFELWWKTLQKYLQYQGLIEEHGPAAIIRTAFHYEFIDNGDGFMDMLKDRNLITNTYKEDIAVEIYENIKNKHIQLLEEFMKIFDGKIMKI